MNTYLIYYKILFYCWIIIGNNSLIHLEVYFTIYRRSNVNKVLIFKKLIKCLMIKNMNLALVNSLQIANNRYFLVILDAKNVYDTGKIKIFTRS